MLSKIDPNSPSCILPQCKKCKGAYKVLVWMWMLIVFYFFFLSSSFGGRIKRIVTNDFMNVKLFDFPLLENCCSVWPLSHFVFFFILGLLFPDCDIPIIGLGVLWEGFEAVNTVLEGGQRQWVRPTTSSSKYEYSKNWWAGSAKDIVMNTLGFYLAKAIVKLRGGKVVVHGLNCDCDEK